MGVEKQLALNIKLLRKTKGLSQERLANQINMSPAYFRSIEHGVANPSLQALERIAACLGTTVGNLLEDDVANDEKFTTITAGLLSTQISAIRKALDRMDHLAGDNCRVEVESMRNAINEMDTLLKQLQIPL